MRDELSSQAKSALARGLSVLAGGLHMAASAAHQGARALRPPTERAHPPPPPTGATAGTEAHPARSGTVIGDLVHRPAREVIGEMDRLSADELRRLREHERAGKQRKTVLEAVDTALASRTG